MRGKPAYVGHRRSPLAPPPAPSNRPPASTYNVRDYQNPDAGSDQPLAKGASAKGKGKSGGGASPHACFHCGNEARRRVLLRPLRA